MPTYDVTTRFDPDCSTCAHRLPRHPSKRTGSRPRELGYVCMVCGCPIGEHGTRMRLGAFADGWAQDVPCKVYDNGRGAWHALDWEAADGG